MSAAPDIDLSEYSNAELEEMGFPPPCECLSTYTEIDQHGQYHVVCVDCNASSPTNSRRFQW